MRSTNWIRILLIIIFICTGYHSMGYKFIFLAIMPLEFVYLTVILSFMRGFASKLIMTHPTRGISFVFPSIQSPCNMAEK